MRSERPGLNAEAPVLLVYRALGIGDLLTAVPALRGLRRAHPHHRIAVVCPDPLAPLLRMTGAVDHHLAVTELAPLPPMRQPDVAVNLHGRGPQSHRVLLAVAPRRLLAHAHVDVPRSHDGPPWIEDQHEITRWCRLLSWFGMSADEQDLHIAPLPGGVPAATRHATVLHPGAKSAARRWPVTRFAAVAKHERLEGRRVVVTGSSGEAARVDAVARAAGLPSSSTIIGGDLGRLARIIAAADRIVCGDTGVSHLATALGTPSVSLFGPSTPSRWGPPSTEQVRHRVLWTGSTGDPLGNRVDPGLLEITVDDVIRELRALPSPERSRRRPSEGWTVTEAGRRTLVERGMT